MGNIARKFAQDILTVESTELYAVASRDREKSENFAAEYHAKKAYGSYIDLAKDPDIDAIYIATPHSFHKEHSILCLQHKKAVLCEKPFAMNEEEVEEMIAAAKENDVLLMEALWTCFLPHYQYVLKMLKAKTFGEIVKIEADFGFFRAFDESSRLFDKKVGGGSLLDIGIYPIFTALSTLGEPDRIEAEAAFFENGTDASCSMVLHYKHAKAFLKSTLLEDTPTEAVFHCERGTIKINPRFFAPSTVTLISEGKEKNIDFGSTTIGYNFETAHFNQLLRDQKKESDIMTFDFSKKLIKTLDRVRNIIGLQYG